MSDDNDAQRKFAEWKEGLVKALNAMARVAAAAQDESKQIAADLGDPQNADNRMLWATLYNVVTAINYEVNSGSPELRTVLDLARTVTPRQRDQWADTKRVTEAMYDEGDAGVVGAIADRAVPGEGACHG